MFWRMATFKERMPPPVGVESGPLIDTVAVHHGCSLTRIDRHPANLAIIAIGHFDRSLHDIERNWRNIGANAVALNVRDDRKVGNIQRVVRVHRNGLAICRHSDMVVLHEKSRIGPLGHH
jgi:hypothetical protein